MSERMIGKLIFEPALKCELNIIRHDLTAISNEFKAADFTQDQFVVADAKIINRKELLSQLGLKNPNINDAELILHAYRKWNEYCPQYLIGDFAFAIWDAKQKKLFLARDPLGKRMLFYYFKPGQAFYFATTVKDLFSNYPLTPILNQEKLANFLVNIMSDYENTFYKDIKRLSGGHSLCIENKKCRLHNYWSIATVLQKGPLSQPLMTSIEQCREWFIAGIKSQIPTHGFLGAHFSGGLDSSAITAAAARLLGKEKLFAFHYLPQRNNESEYLRALKDNFPNVEVLLFEGMEEQQQHLYEWMENPYRIPGAVNWHQQFFKSAQKNNVSTLLMGDMGDHTISWHGFSKSSYFKNPLRKILVVLQFLQPLQKRLRYSSGINPQFLRRMQLSFRYAEYLAQTQKIFSSYAGRPGIFKYQMLDAENSLYNALRAQYGITHYDPFSDRRIVELCARLPNDVFTDGIEYRLFARKIFADMLPKCILDRKVKRGNLVDWRLCLRQQRPLFVDGLNTWEKNEIAEYLDLKYLRKLLAAGDSRSYAILNRAMDIGFFIQNILIHVRRGFYKT